MNGIETVAFGTLWAALFLLGALVFLLYRQVEKAYAVGTGLENVGLPPGVEAPEVEIVTSNGVGALELPSNGEITLVAFLTTSCESCVKLAEVLRRGEVHSGTAIGLVSGENDGTLRGGEDGRFRMLWLAHPPDIVRSYGVNLTPLVYVLRGKTILASKSVHSAAGLGKLLQEAQTNEAGLKGAVGSKSARSPAFSND